MNYLVGNNINRGEIQRRCCLGRGDDRPIGIVQQRITDVGAPPQQGESDTGNPVDLDHTTNISNALQHALQCSRRRSLSYE